MPATPVLIAIAAGVVLVALAAAIAARRRRRGPTSGPDLPPAPGGGGQRTSKVRVLPSAENAREARAEALNAEMASLRREAEYAEQRGLYRRAERLRAMIDDRRRQLESRSTDAH